MRTRGKGARVLAVAALLAPAMARAQDRDDLKPIEPEPEARPSPSPAPTAEPRPGATEAPRPVASKPAPDVAPVRSSSKGDPFALEELTVTGEMPRSAASSEVVRARDFELRPIRTPADLLRLVPGLWTAQHQGGGKADQLLLRGFDADHGTDVAIFEEGVPVNLRSHAHGQGYADQHGVIPEMVESVEIRKGTYFADLGDFATAGAVRYVWRDSLPGEDRVLAKAEGGSFGTTRDVVALSPVKSSTIRTIVSGEAYYTDGPTENDQRYTRLNFFTKGAYSITNDLEVCAWATLMSQRWYGSGQIPLRAVREHLIDEFGAIDPSEGGRSTRTNSQLQLRWMPDAQDLLQVRAYGCQETLRLDTDFHFFEDDPTAFYPEGIQQVDQRWLAGGDAKFEHAEKVFGIPTKLTIGIETRHDLIDVKLRHQIHRQPAGDIVGDHIIESSVAEYAELEVQPIRGVRLIGGVRGDEYWYTVHDTDPDAEQFIQGSKNDSLPQGKGSLVLGPFKSQDPDSSTELYFSVGSGFHSNDARAVVQAKHGVTLPQAITYEVGARTFAFDRLDVGMDFFLIDLESELVFNGDEAGAPQPAGRTRRLGAELELRLRVVDDWLWAEQDLCYTEGRFSVSNLPIPLAPRLLSRTGLTLKTPVGFQASVNANFLGKRPLDDLGRVDAPSQFTADLLLKYIPPALEGRLELFCRIENIFNASWREAQFYDHSQLKGESKPMNDITFTPGAPISVYGGVQIKW